MTPTGWHPAPGTVQASLRAPAPQRPNTMRASCSCAGGPADVLRPFGLPTLGIVRNRRWCLAMCTSCIVCCRLAWGSNDHRTALWPLRVSQAPTLVDDARRVLAVQPGARFPLRGDDQLRLEMLLVVRDATGAWGNDQHAAAATHRRTADPLLVARQPSLIDRVSLHLARPVREALP